VISKDDIEAAAKGTGDRREGSLGSGKIECPACEGSGKIGDNTCPKCAGFGAIPDTRGSP
jgi:DnaJ-class molecular chaperone